jgi:hypothetical protein
VLAVAVLAVVARVIGASWEGAVWRVLGFLVVCVICGAISEAFYSLLTWRPERRDDRPPPNPDRRE